MTVSQEKKEEQSLNLESISWGDLTWVNIERPKEKEMEYLAANYSFHHLDLDDCLSRLQRPKIDEYKEYLFIVLHFPVFNIEARVTTPSQVAVFIGKSYLVTVHDGELKPLVKLFKECQIDEASRQEFFSQGSGFLLYRLLDRLVDYCLPILNKVGANIEAVEEAIFTERMGGTVRELSIIRRDVISFRRIIWPMRAVVASLEHRISRFTGMDLVVYFGDMIDHLDKIWDGLDEYNEIVSGLNDTYDSLATNRTNEVMRMLTVIGTVLLPLIVVSSIYGMNIPLPFQNSALALLLVLFVTFVMIATMLYFFRRRRWI